MNGSRTVRNIAAGAVAAIAGLGSYLHMRDLAAANGQPDVVAALVPFSVDGLMVVAAVTMADDRSAGRPVRRTAYAAFVVGVLASIGANIAAAPPTTLARVISAWPAVALLAVVELLARSGRPSAPSRPADAHANEPDPLVSVAAELVDQLGAADNKVTRDALAAALRVRGHRVGTARAGALLRAVRT